MIYLKKFSTNQEYETFTADTASFIKPNVSFTVDNNQVYYNPIETRVVAKFNVTDTSSPTQIGYNQYTSGFSEIEIDGVAQPSVASAYTFDTVGEHTVKYTLTDSTTIGPNAFRDCSGLTSIDIPNSVTSIGTFAFSGCTRLTSIDIPNSVTSIGRTAFDNTPWWRIYSVITSHHYGNVIYINDVAYKATASTITSAELKDSTVSISDAAFSATSLTSIDIPDSVTSIGTNAFQNCRSLTSCTIGSGVTTIGTFAFSGCTRLTSIICNAATAPIITAYTFRNVKKGGTLTVPSGSSGYNTWMQNASFYLGLYGWTKVEQ